MNLCLAKFTSSPFGLFRCIEMSPPVPLPCLPLEEVFLIHPWRKVPLVGLLDFPYQEVPPSLSSLTSLSRKKGKGRKKGKEKEGRPLGRPPGLPFLSTLFVAEVRKVFPTPVLRATRLTLSWRVEGEMRPPCERERLPQRGAFLRFWRLTQRGAFLRFWRLTQRGAFLNSLLSAFAAPRPPPPWHLCAAGDRPLCQRRCLPPRGGRPLLRLGRALLAPAKGPFT